MTPSTHVMDFECFCEAQIDRIRRDLASPATKNGAGTTIAQDDDVNPAYSRDENAEDKWHPSTRI